MEEPKRTFSVSGQTYEGAVITDGVPGHTPEEAMILFKQRYPFMENIYVNISGTQPQPVVKSQFAEICDGMAELYDEKNHDYANGGDPHGNFKRVAKFFENYPKLRLSDPVVVALTYMMKQLDAVLWAKNIGYKTKVETLDAKYQDIAIYSVIARMIDSEKGDDVI